MTEAGHVQQVLNVAIEAFGFVAGAFQQLTAILQGNGLTEGQQTIDTAAHGGQRGTQIMRHRGQQGTAQLLGFAVQPRGFQVIGQLCSGQRLGQRLAQRGQQTPTLAAQGLVFFGTHTEQRQRPLLH
ncbi:hypothetical protein D3C76_1500130 [compost metagenome]